MDAMTIAWIVIMVGATILEFFTNNLVSIWFTGGAIAALLMRIFMPNIIAECVIFVAVTAVLLVLTRPLAMKLKRRRIPTNADRIIGQEARVIQDVDSNNGQIIVAGTVWTAKNKKGLIIERNTRVRVTGIEGVKAVIEPIGK